MKYIIRYEKVPKHDHQNIALKMVEYIKAGKHKNLVFPSTSENIVSPFQQKIDEIERILPYNDSGCIRFNLSGNYVKFAQSKITIEEGQHKWNPAQMIIGDRQIKGTNKYIDAILSAEDDGPYTIVVYVNFGEKEKLHGYCNKCGELSYPKKNQSFEYYRDLQCSCDDYSKIKLVEKSVHTHKKTRQFIHFLEYMSILNIEYTLEQVSDNNNNN